MTSPAPSSADARRYLAFISYSSRDQKHAKWLIGALETYRVPSNLVGRNTHRGPVPKRLVPIFRDRDELRADAELTTALGAALDQSRNLIVLCSPSSARPESWVNKEIVRFKSSGRQADILALILDGTPHASEQPGNEAQECFPKALRYGVDAEGRITGERVEPVAADLLREDPRPRVSRRRALLKLVARLIDVEFDEIWRRDRQRRRRRRLWAGAAGLVSAAVLFGLISTGLDATRNDLSARLVQQAGAAMRDRPDTALLLSVAAYDTSPTAAAYRSLLSAVDATEHMATSFRDLAEVSALTLRGDGKRLAVAGCATAGCADPSILLYNLETNRSSHAPIVFHAEKVTDLAFHPAAERLLAVVSSGGGGKLISLDLAPTSAEPEQLYAGSQKITGAAMSGDGTLYAVALSDGHAGEFKLFPAGAGRRCGDILDSPIESVRFSPDARHLAFATASGPIYVVDTADCATRKLFYMRSQSVAVDAYGRSLIAIMADSTTTEWNLAFGDSQGRPLPVFASPIAGYLHELSPDASYLASQDGTAVLLTDLATRRHLFQLIRETDNEIEQENLTAQLDRLKAVRLTGHGGAPRLLRFSADNGTLATADAQGKVIVWDVQGSPLVERADSDESAEEDSATELAAGASKEAVSPDGHIVATVSEQSLGCDDGVFNPTCTLTTRLTLRSREAGEDIGSLEDVTPQALAPETLVNRFAPDGDLITLASELDGPLAHYYTWHIAPRTLLEHACRRANRPLGPGDPDMPSLVLGWRAWLVDVACETR